MSFDLFTSSITSFGVIKPKFKDELKQEWNKKFSSISTASSKSPKFLNLSSINSFNKSRACFLLVGSQKFLLSPGWLEKY